MDKRKNKILMGCLALLLVMTVGYALFSENITINGTATAKGDFDITLNCSPWIPESFPRTNYNYFFGGSPSILLDNNYKNDGCVVNDNEVSYYAELTQPGAVRNFLLEIKNNGSITAELPIIEEEMFISFERCEGNFEDDTFSNCTSNVDGNSLTQFDIIGGKDASGTVQYFTKDNEAGMLEYLNIEGEPYKFIIEPGETLYVKLVTEWEADNDNGFAPGNSAYYKDIFKIKFPFKQQTVN